MMKYGSDFIFCVGECLVKTLAILRIGQNNSADGDGGNDDLTKPKTDFTT